MRTRAPLAEPQRRAGVAEQLTRRPVPAKAFGLHGPGDPEALAAAIGRLLDDPALAARIGAAGRARVVERFTWRAVAEQTVAWFRTCTSTPMETPC